MKKRIVLELKEPVVPVVPVCEIEINAGDLIVAHDPKQDASAAVIHESQNDKVKWYLLDSYFGLGAKKEATAYSSLDEVIRRNPHLEFYMV